MKEYAIGFPGAGYQSFSAEDDDDAKQKAEAFIRYHFPVPTNSSYTLEAPSKLHGGRYVPIHVFYYWGDKDLVPTWVPVHYLTKAKKKKNGFFGRKKVKSDAKAPFVYPVKGAPAPVQDEWSNSEYFFKYHKEKGGRGEAKAYINPNGLTFAEHCKEIAPTLDQKFIDCDYGTQKDMIRELVRQTENCGASYTPSNDFPGGFIFGGVSLAYYSYMDWVNGRVYGCSILDDPSTDELEHARVIKDKSELPKWPVIKEEGPYYGSSDRYCREIDDKLRSEIPYSKRRFRVDLNGHIMTGEQLDGYLQTKSDRTKAKKISYHDSYVFFNDDHTSISVDRVYAKKKRGPLSFLSAKRAAKEESSRPKFDMNAVDLSTGYWPGFYLTDSNYIVDIYPHEDYVDPHDPDLDRYPEKELDNVLTCSVFKMDGSHVRYVLFGYSKGETFRAVNEYLANAGYGQINRIIAKGDTDFYDYLDQLSEKNPKDLTSAVKQYLKRVKQ